MVQIEPRNIDYLTNYRSAHRLVLLPSSNLESEAFASYRIIEPYSGSSSEQEVILRITPPQTPEIMLLIANILGFQVNSEIISSSSAECSAVLIDGTVIMVESSWLHFVNNLPTPENNS